MATKTAIKVIKRDERNRQENNPEQAQTNKQTSQGAAREIVATVSNWVNEFQQQRRAETSRALKTLFPEQQPRPNEA
jgi:hypothetical protein